MLNLAMTDLVDGGWPLGRISTLPGQSAAGKTILILNSFAEAAIDPRFAEYELIYDDVERRNDFDMEKLFPPLGPRLLTPGGTLYRDLDEGAQHGISDTIQQLRDRMLILKKEGKRFIYVADSLDSFTTDEELIKELKRALENAKTEEAAKKISGSYNTEKSKVLGQILRQIKGVVADTNSVFILTQQLRQRMNAMPGQKTWVTSGGEAPYYYSHVRPYLSKFGNVTEKKRKIGVHTNIDMDKNSITGKLRNVQFTIYNEIGIDDLGSMISFLVQEKHWKSSGGWIEATELNLKENGKDKLIKVIEEKGLEKKVKRVAQRKWNKIEESLKLNRKPRYE